MAMLQLYLCRGGKTPINECPVPDTEQSDVEAPVLQEVLGNSGFQFIAITPRSTLTQSGNTWLGPIYGSNRTIWHLVQTNDLC